MTETIGLRVFVDEGETAKLYTVWNTSNSKLLVLAQNGSTAAHTALCRGHVKDVRNATVGLVDLASPSDRERKFYSSVKAAIKDGRQGIVRNMDGFAVFDAVGHTKTYAPLVEVRSE